MDAKRSQAGVKVRIPFALKLAECLPFEIVRTRRDFPKLLGLIEVSAFLHQHQREKVGDTVIADAQDYQIAKQLFEHSYGAGSEKAVRELVAAAPKADYGVDFSVADLVRKLSWGKTKVYNVLKRAAEQGYIADSDDRGRYVFVRSVDESPLKLPEMI